MVADSSNTAKRVSCRLINRRRDMSDAFCKGPDNRRSVCCGATSIRIRKEQIGDATDRLSYPSEAFDGVYLFNESVQVQDAHIHALDSAFDGSSYRYRFYQSDLD
jgi:hypothetical protein